MSLNQGNVTRYFNNGKSSQQQTDPILGLTNVSVSNNNGIQRCQFDRIKYMPSSDGKYYSLFSSYYVLFAKGTLSGSNDHFKFFNFKKEAFT